MESCFHKLAITLFVFGGLKREKKMILLMKREWGNK